MRLVQQPSNAAIPKYQAAQSIVVHAAVFVPPVKKVHDPGPDARSVVVSGGVTRLLYPLALASGQRVERERADLLPHRVAPGEGLNVPADGIVAVSIGARPLHGPADMLLHHLLLVAQAALTAPQQQQAAANDPEFHV